MAIERLFQIGFELNSLNAEGGKTATSNILISNARPKTGTYSLKFNFNGYLRYQVAPTSQIRVGFHINTNGGFQDTTYICSFRDASAANVLISIRSDASNNISLYLGAVKIGSSMMINNDQYYHFGIDIKKDGSSGWVNFYIDGNLIASTSGNTSATQIEYVDIGPSTGQMSGTLFCYVDDLIIDNTTGESAPAPVPDQRFTYLVLTGDGTYTEFTPFTGTVHYTLLDEIPPVATDYIYAVLPGKRDSFQFTDYTSSVGETIDALIPTAVARKESSSDILLGLGSGLSGTFSLAGFSSLPTSYGLFIFKRLPTNVFGNSWVDADVNNSQIYIMSSGTYS